MSEGSLPSTRETTLRPRKKRAPSMAPTERRLQLIDTAVPLVARHGSAVTTAQVAEAAGVAEGTIFRLFADKESLLDAVLVHALDAEPLLDSLALLPEELAVEARVQRAAESIRLHFEVALPVMHGAMRHGHSARAGSAVGAMFALVLEAAESLFEGEIARGRLRGDSRTLGRMLVGVCQAVVWQDYFERGERRAPTEAFTSVLLQGCLVARDGSPGPRE